MKLIADGVNLTSYCSSISVTADLAGHTATLAFSLPKGLGAYGAPYMPICGSIVSLFLAEEVFRGIVVTLDDGKRDVIRYTACDFGFYLNKNKEVYQFAGIPAGDAIGRVCALRKRGMTQTSLSSAACRRSCLSMRTTAIR